MPSLIKKKSSERLTPEVLALCLLLASSLQIMENLLPKVPVFPWLRLGLAYLIILPFLLRFGALKATVLFVSRNIIALAYGGQIFSAFIISTLSGLLSLGMTGYLACYLYHKNRLGLLGTSVLLAGSFNVMQLVFANHLFIHHGDFNFQLGPLLIWSLATGSLIAFLVSKSGRGLDFLFNNRMGFEYYWEGQNEGALSIEYKAKFACIGCLFFALFLAGSSAVQSALLALILVFTRFGRLKTVYYAWPFYFYLAWLHLFRTEGVYIFKDWITREGLEHFVFYFFRTTNIILCGQWLAGYVPCLWKRAAANLYLRGMAIAMPLLPALFGFSISMGKAFFRQLRRGNFDNLLGPVIERLGEELEKAGKDRRQRSGVSRLRSCGATAGQGGQKSEIRCQESEVRSQNGTPVIPDGDFSTHPARRDGSK